MKKRSAYGLIGGGILTAVMTISAKAPASYEHITPALGAAGIGLVFLRWDAYEAGRAPLIRMPDSAFSILK